MLPEEVEFGGRTVEPYRDQIHESDPRVTRLAACAVALVVQEAENAVVDNRVAEYRALLGHFEAVAGGNGGVVPIAAIRDILADALEAKI